MKASVLRWVLWKAQSVLSLVGMDSIRNLYIHITHPLVYSGLGMKNDEARLFAGMVISFKWKANRKRTEERRSERRLEDKKKKNSRRWSRGNFSGLTFGHDIRSWQTLAFADITEVISCLSFLRTLHLVPPGEKEKERNVGQEQGFTLSTLLLPELPLKRVT